MVTRFSLSWWKKESYNHKIVVCVGFTAYQPPRSFGRYQINFKKGKRKSLLWSNFFAEKRFVERTWFYWKFISRESSCTKIFLKSLWNGSDSVEVFLVEKQFVGEIWSGGNFIEIFSVYIYRMALHVCLFVCFFFQYFGTILSCRLHNKMFILYGPGRYIQWECVSQCISSGMDGKLFATLLQVCKNELSLFDLYEVCTKWLPLFEFSCSFVSASQPMCV